MKEDKQIIKSVDDRPCGCRITVYASGSEMLAPCVPCGLFAVANNLNQASQALAAVATRFQQMQNAAQMQQAISKVVRP